MGIINRKITLISLEISYCGNCTGVNHRHSRKKRNEKWQEWHRILLWQTKRYSNKNTRYKELDSFSSKEHFQKEEQEIY